MAALNGDSRRRHVGEPDGVVGLGKDGFGDVRADLLRVDVERRDDADVADVVATELDMHQAGDRLVGVGILVVLQTLDQGRGAIAKPHDRDANLSHRVRSFLRSVALARRRSPTGAVISYLWRSFRISSVSQAMSDSVPARPRAQCVAGRGAACRVPPRGVLVVAARPAGAELVFKVVWALPGRLPP